MLNLQLNTVNIAPKQFTGLSKETTRESISQFMLYDSLHDKSSKQTDNFIFRKTAKNVSFGGLSLSEVNKIKQSKLWKFLNNKTLEKFIGMADASQTIFDAVFALGITCVLRPAAIMAQSNEKNKEKNKKAASHSISSGLIGYGFAVAIFSPIKTGLNKLKAHPEIFAKKAAKFMGSTKNAQTFTMLVNKSTEALTASVRSAITIALIPFIDKYLLNKIFGTPQNNKKVEKQELQNPIYKYSIINFKNNAKASKTFQNFTGGLE